MNNATKGPWDIGVKRCKYRCLPEPEVAARMKAAGIPFEFEALSIGTDKGTVCLVPLDESNEDNAKLLVKTPDLLSALRKDLEMFRHYRDWSNGMDVDPDMIREMDKSIARLEATLLPFRNAP